jgi:cytochrome c-type biogenesis protein CcmH/NrfF
MTITALLWVLVFPIVIAFGVILWATESRSQRIHRLRRQGWSQQRIASHLQISRYQVRLAIS